MIDFVLLLLHVISGQGVNGSCNKGWVLVQLFFPQSNIMWDYQ